MIKNIQDYRMRSRPQDYSVTRYSILLKVHEKTLLMDGRNFRQCFKTSEDVRT